MKLNSFIIRSDGSTVKVLCPEHLNEMRITWRDPTLGDIMKVIGDHMYHQHSKEGLIIG